MLPVIMIFKTTSMTIYLLCILLNKLVVCMPILELRQISFSNLNANLTECTLNIKKNLPLKASQDVERLQ